MKQNLIKSLILIALFLSATLVYKTAQAQQLENDNVGIQNAATIEELDPRADNIDEILQDMDREYYRQTGQLPYILPNFLELSCQRFDCPIYAEVRKSEQKLYLYIKGALTYTWLVSTGSAKSETPTWEGHPNGRIYDKYSSKANPGGDYKGLGNMPYAVFLNGPYAIHGTVASNFKKLGTKASHGCVRVHPDNGYIFNRLVRQYGIEAVWVSVIK